MRGGPPDDQPGPERNRAVGHERLPAAAHPHGFVSGADGLYLLSVQVPRPLEGATTWDQPGETTDPIDCAYAGTCRRCPRCGGHSLNMRAGLFMCENCTLEF